MIETNAIRVFALLCCLAAGPLVAQPGLKHAPELLQPGPMRIDLVKDGLYLIRELFERAKPKVLALTTKAGG